MSDGFQQVSQNFPVGQAVEFGRTGGPMDGLRGRILGTAHKGMAPPPDFYIVLLETPLDENLAVVMSEVCIRPIKMKLFADD